MAIIPQVMYGWYIKWLMANDTPQLFSRLYQLDWYKSLHEQWLTDLQCQSLGRFLDVGCGPGLFACAAAQAGLDVFGVDRSPAMISAAHKYNRHTANISLRQADATLLPFAANQFETVVAASLINIVKRPDVVLSEMVRVAKFEGRVSFLVPSEQMTQQQVALYILNHKLSGFSAKALKTWAHFPPKFSAERCESLAHKSRLQEVKLTERLDGMVFSVEGIKRW